MSWIELENGGLFNINNGSEYVLRESTGGAELWSSEVGVFVGKLSSEEFKQIKEFLLNKEDRDNRDKFAMAALRGILSSSHPSCDPPLYEDSDDIAKYAYKYADSMMKEREKWKNKNITQSETQY